MNYSVLKELLTTKKINIPALAKEIGMTKTGLYITIDKERLTVEKLEQIAKVLDVPVAIFFNQENWIPISEVEKLNNEITRLQKRLKEVEEQLEDKRKIIQVIEEKGPLSDESEETIIALLTEAITERIGKYFTEMGVVLTEEEYRAVQSKDQSPEKTAGFEKMKKLKQLSVKLTEKHKEENEKMEIRFTVDEKPKVKR